MGRLTPTSYALLGLLALRSWSAYELTRYMRTSPLRAIWPRAESHLYSEPKKLVAHGLAQARRERRAGRRRTVYRITPTGRQALQRWLSHPVRHFGLESASMLQVAYADLGTSEGFERMIDEFQGHLLGEVEVFREVVEGLLEQGFPFPERMHVSAMVDRFVLEIVEARLRWAAFAREFLQSCRAGGEPRARRGEQELRAIAARLRELAAAGGTGAPASAARRAPGRLRSPEG